MGARAGRIKTGGELAEPVIAQYRDGYWMDGPRFDSLERQDLYPKTSRPTVVPTQPSVCEHRGCIPGLQRPGREVDHPPASRSVEKGQFFFSVPSKKVLLNPMICFGLSAWN